MAEAQLEAEGRAMAAEDFCPDQSRFGSFEAVVVLQNSFLERVSGGVEFPTVMRVRQCW
jgi:hypothetical protein